MKNILSFCICCFITLPIYSQNISVEDGFEKANSLEWTIVFEDNFSEPWQNNWSLDGIKAQVTTHNNALNIYSGNEALNDTCHAVLWTKDIFHGDLKIEYDFTRLDSSTTPSVNIIYLLATGSGKGEYTNNIMEWNELRKAPAMKCYFDHMNTYHISYAVVDPGKDYVRGRRYIPETGNGLNGTALTPEYSDTGLFGVGIKHHITIIRRGAKLFMNVISPTKSALYWFDTSTHPNIESGRIGLRQMWTRASQYENFKVSGLK